MIEKISSLLTSLAPISSTKAHHDYFNCFLKSKADIEGNLTIPLKAASILVVGCGYFYPDVVFYSTCAKKVAGIDVKTCFWRDGFAKTFLNALKTGKGIKGIVIAASDTFRSRFLITKNYYARLEQHIGQKIVHKNLELFSYNGKDILFDDNTFDAVISNAVLEHVMDLPYVIKEMARVTKGSGLNYHLYHNYYSFSGNHKPYDLNKRYPWGHLRGLIETDPGHLNKVKVADMEKLFVKHFENVEVFSVDRNHYKRGVDNQFKLEEETLFHLYKDEIGSEFPAELLLSRGFLLKGKKRINPSSPMISA